jgi:hypothetical protein
MIRSSLSRILPSLVTSTGTVSVPSGGDEIVPLSLVGRDLPDDKVDAELRQVLADPMRCEARIGLEELKHGVSFLSRAACRPSIRRWSRRGRSTPSVAIRTAVRATTESCDGAATLVNRPR